MSTIDLIIYLGGAAMAGSFVYILWTYYKGLKDSPRELLLLFVSKILEYIAYGSANLAFVLFLSSDVGLGDISAGSYIGVWSMTITLTTMFIGSVADAIGIKKTLLTGTIILLLARIVMPFTTNIYVLTLFSFLPLGVGMAMMTPVLSVGIKKFTTAGTLSLGFGLFYTLMNVGWAGGAWVFDFIRGIVLEKGGHVQLLGFSLSAYQMIFFVGFICTVANLIIVMLMRDGVDYQTRSPVRVKKTDRSLKAGLASVKKAAVDTWKIIRVVFAEKPFWVFLFMLGLLIFVRFTFYHFHYTFPKYGLRVLGEKVKIGSIFGVLNPVMIVFLTPLFAAMFKKVRSYIMLLVGTTITSVSIFIATLPDNIFEPLMGTWFSELILSRWLNIAPEGQQPLVLALVIMVMVFTVGEAIWSPRLMQFTAEIAPKGKEGSYIALSALPFFAAKFFVGPLSGWLVATYTPEGATSYPLHYVVWLWIGGMSLISPLGLVVFHKLFSKAEHRVKMETIEASKGKNQNEEDGEPTR
ncbi:MAG TPA: hypothetical protein DCS07_03110 [Bdellovibrionales bacterium]|nr:MAG: hypothetical protein A2X97_12970 [Bdellovibrionales bacterium GWA1_52_35]OFZ42680.1 MAG: hypothetical protein A2070_09695 [Bdellovibrionales bacterium GWC1_52_8]HAR41613.1 hypothetical protein [Bdellovibrionales bacterium]HCM39937.1 hypothetical protein [Bdellovibrionales bacterium]